MDDHHTTEPMSESVEMYLLRIALLQDEDKPVPISTLAEELAISPVSANQMCRKLEERGVVHYEPYRGVRLTLQGEATAMRVLRRRRLWEVFLAENLGLDPVVAEEIACRFEHVTPDGLAERLAEFLGNPTLSPQHQLIPPSIGTAARWPRATLAELGAGLTAEVVQIDGDSTILAFMRDQGLVTGAHAKILAKAANGSTLIEVHGNEMVLSAELTQLVQVTQRQDSKASTSLEDALMRG